METGIYEVIINQMFRCKLDALDKDKFYIGEDSINKEKAVNYLSDYLLSVIRMALHAYESQEDSVSLSVKLVNSIIKMIVKDFGYREFDNNLVDTGQKILTAIINKTTCEYPDIKKYIEEITPITTLTQSALFTGKNQATNMRSELNREIQCADEICFLVSFIRMSGLNLIKKELKKFAYSGRKIRIITTTYTRATEYRAVKEIALLPNTEVKISYNIDNDRLHAKSYLFLRKTGFHTAYIGSSNLSGAALTDGLEWNIKVSQAQLPQIILTIKNTFDTYWEDDEFETFVSGRDDERLKRALGYEDSSILRITDLVNPFDYQKEILERLSVEREVHGCYRNLLVAATGTGKTVIAAYDYKRFKEANPRANMLFVVHREEIIKHACSTFRNVLHDENFGEMWYGGCTPTRISHLFASKDMLRNRLDGLNLPEDYYDYIIIDEVHHVAAASYRSILEKFKPKILLGMTATPERMDGEDITQDFGSRISAEIRLPEALNTGLLSPFHYYGITDSVDLAEIKWERGGFVASELSKVYTYNDRRTGVVLRAVEEYLDDFSKVSALCFCVDIEHANYMCSKFTLAGLKSCVFTSEQSSNRRVILNKFSRKEINYLFVVDIFNEGIDVPGIDTILFLRPTESLTIFLQQFGRGLRKTQDKEFLTVLDFVGHTRAEFNYSDRFRSLIGRTSMSTLEEAEHDFPHLPVGCHIVLEEKAKDYIIENLRGNLKRFGKNKLVSYIKNFEREYDSTLSLANFIKLTHIELERIYRGGDYTWAYYCNLADISGEISPLNKSFGSTVYKKWLSTDSYSYFGFIRKLVDSNFAVNENSLCQEEKKMALMLYYDLFKDGGYFNDIQEMFNTLRDDTVLIAELKQLLPLLQSRCQVKELKDECSKLRLLSCPLRLHSTYTKDQILVALGASTISKKNPNREGVLRIKTHNIEAMFVDIIKDREEGSSTNYNDFALSDTLFNWETQNSVSQTTQTGQNYINGNQTMLLFVRQQSSDPEDKNRTLGFVYLGEVSLADYSGNKPMQIKWRLKIPMPASMLNYAKKHKAYG